MKFPGSGRRMSRGLRTVRQEQLFQPKFNKLSLTSFVATEVGRRERGTSLQGEVSEARESGSGGIQGRLMTDREERLGLQARISSSPPYSPQRSSTPGEIITIDRCIAYSFHLDHPNIVSAMPSQQSLQHGRQVPEVWKETEEEVDWQQTSLAMNSSWTWGDQLSGGPVDWGGPKDLHNI